MKIKHINSPKAGTVEHIRNDVGQTLVAAGFAEEIKLPNRNDPGWLAARLEQSKLAGAPDPHDVVIESGTSWGIYQQFDKVAVVKSVNGEKTFFDAPPSDCPERVRLQFFNAGGGIEPEVAAAQREAATRERMETDQKAKFGGGFFRRT